MSGHQISPLARRNRRGVTSTTSTGPLHGPASETTGQLGDRTELLVGQPIDVGLQQRHRRVGIVASGDPDLVATVVGRADAVLKALDRLVRLESAGRLDVGDGPFDVTDGVIVAPGPRDETTHGRPVRSLPRVSRDTPSRAGLFDAIAALTAVANRSGSATVTVKAGWRHMPNGSRAPTGSWNLRQHPAPGGGGEGDSAVGH